MKISLIFCTLGRVDVVEDYFRSLVDQTYTNYEIIINFEKFSEDTSKILLNHSLIFFTYFLSGIFAKKIVNLSIQDKSYSNLFLVFYLI